MWDKWDSICVWKSLTTFLLGWKGNPSADKECVCLCVYVCVLGLWVWDQINTFSHALSDVSACVEKVRHPSQTNCDHTHNQTLIWEQDKGQEGRGSKISSVYLFKSSMYVCLYSNIHIPDTKQLSISLSSVPQYACPYFQQINKSIFSSACDSPEITKHRVAIESASSAVSRAGSSHMITALTAPMTSSI